MGCRPQLHAVLTAVRLGTNRRASHDPDHIALSWRLGQPMECTSSVDAVTTEWWPPAPTSKLSAMASDRRLTRARTLPCDGSRRPSATRPNVERRRSWEPWYMRNRMSSLPLFWRAFATNALAMLLAFGALVFAPVTVSIPIAATELVVLASGLVLLLILNLFLLRPAFSPLD